MLDGEKQEARGLYPSFAIGGFTVHTYGLCAAVGLIAALVCAFALTERRGMRGDESMVLVVVAIVPVMVCGSLLYGLTNLPYLAEVVSSRQNYADAGSFLAALAQGFSGLVFYGGLAGAILAVLLFARIRHRSRADLLDVLAVCVPLFHMFGRIGCFLGGCCFGIACPVGFVFTDDPISIANGVTRFPVQLLEAACNLVIFLVLLRLFAKRAHRGNLIAVYFVSYGCVRFADEFLRDDAYRGFLGPFSTSQWISLVVIAIGIALLWREHRRGRYDTREARS